MTAEQTPPSIRPQPGGRRRRCIAPALAAALAGALALSLWLPAAAQMPADSVLQGFALTGEYQFLLDGELKPKAEVYFAARASALLVMASELASPVLLIQRTGQVETVHIMKVAKREDGTVDLLADASLNPLGSYRLDGQDVVFTVAGKEGRLHPRPPLLGNAGRKQLTEHSPEYVRIASAYSPDSATVSRLRRQEKPVKVKVFFGSWCSICKRYLPHAIKVDEALAGSKITFEYYGLPEPPAAWKDDEVARLGVKGVPTGIVFVGGKEVGRILGNDWIQLERSLSTLLKPAGGA